MKQVNIVLAVIILFLAGAVVFLLTRKAPIPAPPDVSQEEETLPDSDRGAVFETYRSRTHGFSFEYPAAYNLEEYTSSIIAIGHKTELGFDAVAEVVFIEGENSSMQSPEEFILDQARLSCAADGPHASISCLEVKSLSAFETSEGVTGQKFYLEERMHTFADDRFEFRDKGPYYTFNTSQITPGGISFLMIRNPAHLSAAEAEEGLIRDIAKSVSLAFPLR